MDKHEQPPGSGASLLIGGLLILLAAALVVGFVPVVTCPQCHGFGAWGGVKGDPDDCPYCNGQRDVSILKKLLRPPDLK